MLIEIQYSRSVGTNEIISASRVDAASPLFIFPETVVEKGGGIVRDPFK